MLGTLEAKHQAPDLEAGSMQFSSNLIMGGRIAHLGEAYFGYKENQEPFPWNGPHSSKKPDQT